MKRQFILVAVAIILLVGAVAAYLYFKPTADSVQANPDVSVTVTELIAAFEKDTAAASQLYLDKIVAVTGIVQSIDTTGSIVLGEEGSLSVVSVGLDRRYLDDHQKLVVGKPATLQGVCSGYATSGSSDPDDLLAGLGTTVQLRSAGVKEK
ncbi:hypothetical protein HRG84_14220 [Flavisolibacter sp. BT320]|nr:hypothetical protein [Flavisolibacter longurius]RYZ14567.1 MAG: hypothetical protein EOP49_53595 [Sphingobacteriales bacterium]